MLDHAVIATPRRRRLLTISLRGLMLAIVVIACVVARAANRARVMREVAAAVAAKGGKVMYDWQFSGGQLKANAAPPGPAWLRRLVGREYFEEIVWVDAGYRSPDDAEMAQVARLGHLESFTGGEPLKGSSLARLRGHMSLRTLSFANRDEPGACLVHVKGLTGLRGLDVNLDFDDADLANLSGLHGLESLGLSHWQPRMTDAGLTHLAGLANLRDLSIRHAKITSAGLAQLRCLPNLETLRLEYTRVESLEPLRACRNLRELWISSGHITGYSPLPELPALEVLALTGDGFDDAVLASLDRCTKLQKVHLGETDVTDRTLECIGRLTNLRDLSLKRTRITDEGLKHLARLAQLKSIDLFETAITDTGLETLSALPQLHHLSLGRTATTRAGAAKFRKSHARTLIFQSIPQPPPIPRDRNASEGL